jgi:predicted PurR-regulated permease PerM
VPSRADRVQPIAQSAIAGATPDEEEVLQSSIRAGSIAQVVVASVAVLGLIYFLKLVLITTLTAILLAFILEPLVDWLSRV